MSGESVTTRIPKSDETLQCLQPVAWDGSAGTPARGAVVIWMQQRTQSRCGSVRSSCTSVHASCGTVRSAFGSRTSRSRFC
jgi:glycerol kinase